MTKDIARDVTLFLFIFILTIGFINPVSKYYTWWNLAYQLNN